MKYIFTSLFIFFLAAGFAKSPVFKSCGENKQPQNCSAQKINEFKDQVEEFIKNEMGVYIEDSLYFKFSVNKNGNLDLEEKFSYLSKAGLKLATMHLHTLKGKLQSTSGDEYYEIAWQMSLNKVLFEFPPLEEVQEFPEMPECADYNLKARSACFRYVFYQVKDELRDQNESLKLRAYFEKGKIVALRAEELPLTNKMADHIILIVEGELNTLTTAESRSASQDFYYDIEISPSNDSLDNWEYHLDRLNYLSSFPQRELFLRQVFNTQEEYFRRKKEEGNTFLLDQLKYIGFDTLAQFHVAGTTYHMDSIKNFGTTIGSVKDDSIIILNQTESIPVYRGCGSFYGNNEDLKQCFQRSIMKFIAENYRFPELARSNRISGKVYVNFVLKKDGTIDEIEIIRGAHLLLDMEAIRIVSLIPDAEKPAMQDGKAVRMSFTLPINAKLR